MGTGYVQLDDEDSRAYRPVIVSSKQVSNKSRTRDKTLVASR